MLKYGLDHVKESLSAYETRMHAKLEQSLRRKAASLGFTRVPRAGAGAVSRGELAFPVPAVVFARLACDFLGGSAAARG